MTMAKFKSGLGVVVIAGAASLICFQRQSQLKLRAENDSLRQQLAQLKSQDQDSQPGSPLPMSDTLDELLQLRGDVTVLRSQTNQLTTLQQQNQQLRQALSTVTNKPPSDPNVAKPPGYFAHQFQIARLAINGLLDYATNHDNRFPDRLDQAADYYVSHGITNLNQFVVTYEGSLTNLANPADAIVVQSFQPWIEDVPNGDGFTNQLLTKIYGFADGHVKAHQVALDNNFDEFEQKHIPVLKSQ